MNSGPTSQSTHSTCLPQPIQSQHQPWKRSVPQTITSTPLVTPSSSLSLNPSITFVYINHTQCRFDREPQSQRRTSRHAITDTTSQRHSSMRHNTERFAEKLSSTLNKSLSISIPSSVSHYPVTTTIHELEEPDTIIRLPPAPRRVLRCIR